MRWPLWMPAGTSTSSSPRLERAAGAGARLARMLDEDAAAAAPWTGKRANEVAEDAAGHLLQTAGAVALAAGRRARPRLDAVSLADLARHRSVVGNRDLFPVCGVDEVDLHLGCEIAAALRCSAAPTAEQVVAEERREEIAETAEVGVRRPEPTRAQAAVPEAVVERAGLVVREHLVRLGHLAKAHVRVRVVGDVRVKLPREAPEGLLDGDLVGVARDPEHLVVVAVSGRHQSSV